jgi:hypothetical protein
VPASLQDLERSIETLYTAPRILMGILAVADTFLIYKIAERRHAVTPLSWLFRRIYLDPIHLPFLLTSILFALYSGIKAKQKEPKDIVTVKSGKENERTSEKVRGESQGEGYTNLPEHTSMSSQNIILLLSSGIFLGLTIFTKVPAITLIPLVGFIVFTNNMKSFKALGLWIIPVILIPLMWPAQTVLGGEFDQWWEGIIYQTTRASKPLFDAVNDFYNKDPVLLILRIAGFAFATITNWAIRVRRPQTRLRNPQPRPSKSYPLSSEWMAERT